MNNKGFTLIEIIAAMIIISIITTVICYKVLDFDNKSNIIKKEYEINTEERFEKVIINTGFMDDEYIKEYNDSKK